jgi:phage baseplate assembly protein V
MRDVFEDIYRHISELRQEVAQANMRSADAERRLDNMFRPGKVTDVDAKKQLYRQEIAEQDGKPVKSAWIPYGQVAGDYKSHSPPTVGQQMWTISPNGDARQAIGIPMTWSDEQKSPSDKPDEHVHTFGDKYRRREKKDLSEFTLDKTKQVFTTEIITTSINGGNTPKDGNGTKADDSSENDQADAGSSIIQEEKKLTHKIGQTKVTQDDKSFTFEAAEMITMKVGGVEFELTPQGYTLVGPTGVLAVGEMLYTGVAGKDDKTGQRVMTEAGPALKHKSKV